MFPLASPDPGHVDPLLLLVAALALDALIGDPAALYRHVPHPVAFLGRVIAGLERRLNRGTARRRSGIVAVAIVVGLAVLAGVLLALLAERLPDGDAVTLIAVAMLVAQRSLWDHVAEVAQALEKHGLSGGRAAVARIVGRDPESLDAAGVARAAIESLAENFSDGVVAPVFWFVLLGLPGICAYKAINTLDSLIGHRSERYRAFGWAAARLDDAANLIPARLAAALIAAGAALVPGASGARAVTTAQRDAKGHRSPNAGWPEAAMAGALDLSLAGPRRYGEEIVADPWLGQGSRGATAADIRRALGLYLVACVVEAALLAALAAWRAGF